MPTTDASTTIKHITTHTVSDEMLTLWKAFPGVRAIVLHMNGKEAERPHYHIWFESDVPRTNEAIKKRLRSYSPVFDKPFSDWKFTLGSEGISNFVKWSNYVIDGSKGSKVLYETPDETHPPLPDFPVVASGGAGASEASYGASEASAAPIKYTIQKARRSESMRSKFVTFLKTELHWERESITLYNRVTKKKEMIHALVDFWENAFTTPQGAACIEHAMWYFADEELGKELKDRAVTRLNEILRC